MSNPNPMKQTERKPIYHVGSLFILAFCICILFPKTTHASNIYEVGLTVTFGQSEAREMLTLVNELRTGADAWYWNADNTTKTVCSGLNELTYDYKLEAAAMQRAVEIAIYYSHTRPNGTNCFTVYDDLGCSIYIAGENIAAGYRTGEAVFEGWKEQNEDYAGQGHRRNMLNKNFTAIGIGHVYYNGCHYWVQQLGGEYSAAVTPANDSETYMKVKIADSEIQNLTLTAGTNTVKCGEKISLSGYKAAVTLLQTWPFGNACDVDAEFTWNLPENTFAKYENGTITGLKAGTTTITATVMGRQKNYEITVQHNPKTVIQKATIKQAGSIQEICDGCGAVISNKTIPVIKSVSLKKSSYNYTGKAITPSVTVKDTTGAVISASNYSITYANNVALGTGTLTVTFKGNYTGTMKKSFKINLSKVTGFRQATEYGTTKIGMVWDLVTGADGYALYRASTKNGSYQYLKTSTINNCTHYGLKAGSKYYYKVRAYKTVNGKKVYGAYSDAKSMLTKPATPTGFAVTLKRRTAKISWAKVTGAAGYEIYVSSSRNGTYTRIKSVGASTISYNKTGLTKGSKYYFKMRAYVKTGTGAKVYSGYSKIKAVTVK